MGAAVFLQQPAIAHRDPGGAGHQVIGEFDAAVAERVVNFLVAVGRHAVEFQQPRLEILAGSHLARADLAGLRVPGDHRLGPRATGGSADAEDGRERFRWLGKMSVQALARGERVVGELDQCLQVQGFRREIRHQGGAEFQGSHRTAAEVTQALDRIKGLGPASLLGQPLVDE